MILKNFSKIHQYFSTQARKQLKWKFNSNGVEIFFQDPKSLQNVVFYATANIKMSQFLIALQIKQKDTVFPEGINAQSDLVTYLLERQNPKAMQFKHKGQQFVLRNRACDPATKDILQALKDQKGIYQQLQQFSVKNKPQFFSQRCDYLVRYYLKLQSQCFCKVKKININDLMSVKIKEDLLNYLNLKNQVNSQDQIQQCLKQQARIKEAMYQTQNKINQLNNFYQNRQNWYKRAAIFVTIGHLVSFGYMIFGVQWLGWDIIEPLTYTVGVLYTLLGIRFYRKYKVSRSCQTIRQALFKMIMPPQKRVLLDQNKARLDVQSKELKKVHQERQILKNHLAYRTSLIQSLQNTL